MLGRKKSVNNEEWLNMHRNVKRIISLEQIERKTEKAIGEIKGICEGKRVAYAWSGGKDSLVLGDICTRAGIKKSMIGINNLEYKAFVEWIDKNKPDNLFIVNTGQDLEWISQNQDMLFPKDSTISGRWYKAVQHKAQEIYYYMAKLDLIILGRRKKDGNFVGREDNIYTSNGITRYSPLSEWTHEEISAYICYNDIELPPIYDWPDGFTIGTHQWASRRLNGTVEKTWQEIYDIDKNIPMQAAKYIESAKKFMEGKNENN